MSELTNEIKQVAKNKEKKEIVEFISTGCTLLDLCLGGGFAKGRMVNIVGDRSTGKTLLVAEFLARNILTLKKNFSFIYDDAEAGFNFDTEKIYGTNIYNPDYDNSDTIEKFEYNIDEALKKVKNEIPYVYVLDTFDALTSEIETKKYKQKIKSIKKKIENDIEEKVKGEYGMDKQKESGKFFRQTCRNMREKNFILIIISQVRENIGIMFGEKYTRSGGKALDFYASQIVWLAECEKMEKNNIVYGVRIKVYCKKNKVGIPFRKCFIDILFDYGIDSITSNINYLYDLLDLKGKRKNKLIEWDNKEYKPDNLVKYIEENNLEQELDKRVRAKWQEIEDSVKIERKRKFINEIHL